MLHALVATAAIAAAVATARRIKRPTPAPTVEAEAPAIGAPPMTPRPAPAERSSTNVLVLLASAVAAVLLGGVVAAAAPRIGAPDPSEAASTPPPAPPREMVRSDSPAVAPIRIDIPAAGVSAAVDEIGLLDDGTMAVPEDFARTGWYGGLEAPGQAGTAVVVGHLDSHTGPAVFFNVPRLRTGDDITITRADNTTVVFVVDRVEQYRKKQFPTIAVYAPTGEPSLRLITCGGKFDRRTRHYSDNIVVYSHLKEAA